MERVVTHITDEKAVIADIQSYKIKGVLILIALQALQIITAIFPAAAIQVLAGLTYGIFYGMFICLAGYVLGNTIIFILVRQFDINFFPLKANPAKKPHKSKWDFSFLRKADNAARMAFILYLIPGIPNAILPYIFAKTKISLPRYLLIIVLAGAPSILLCSLVGERISDGDIFTAALLFGILVLIALIVFFMRNHIIAFVNKHSK